MKQGGYHYNMYKINKSYIEKCLRIIEKTYKDCYFDLYVNGFLYRRFLNNCEVRAAIFLFKNYNGIITQDPAYKSDLYLWLEV